MPELPEVETVVRQLAVCLPNHLIRWVSVFQPGLLKEPPESFRQTLQGSLIRSVNRRGKNILISLSGHGFLVVNLGMTGQLLFHPSVWPDLDEIGEGLPSHLAVLFTLEPAASLLYVDIRRFGSLRLFTPEEWARESARIGPEPLGQALSDEAFFQALSRSRSPIRSWLLDQTRIAGIGNIYACEALFRSGIHPQAPARSLDRPGSSRLLAAVRDVLSDAIRARGTTLRDYRTARGEEGSFGPSLEAYGRGGAPCLRCKIPIVRIVFGNRSAFFCPNCQPRL